MTADANENVGLASNANEALERALVASVSDDPTYGLSILVHRDAIPKFAEWLAAFMRDDGYEVRPIDEPADRDWVRRYFPPIEQASVRPADPAEAVEVCPSCGGEGQRADGSLCLGCQGFGSIEQAAEAVSREGRGSEATNVPPPSAAVAPLDDLDEPMAVRVSHGPASLPVAPSSAEVGLDVDPNPKIDPYALDVEALNVAWTAHRARKHPIGGGCYQICISDIDAAYADATKDKER